ncbi:MAG: hypothetical protein VX642_06020 [Bdellovibrionota bacterium]|nr:hypothetical protein [Bdellovibrionota bacterium]
MSQFLKEVGYDYSPPGFIGTGHCQILRRSQSAVNYCFDDKSVLEKHLQIHNINTDKFPSHISEIRKRNSLIIEIFEASLKGLGLRLDQVICEDFDSRVYTTAQASIPRRYYYRSIYSNQVYADYFLVDKYLAKFLMGNTEDYNSFKAHRGGFYASVSQGAKELKLNLSGEDARQAFAKCVEEEVEYYQGK